MSDTVQGKLQNDGVLMGCRAVGLGELERGGESPRFFVW